MSAHVQSLEPRILLHQPHDPVGVIALSPNFANDHTLLAIEAEEKILFKSTDGGQTYHTPVDAISYKGITSISFSPNFASDGIVFAGTEFGGVYKSTNGGENWTAINSGINNLAIAKVMTGPTYSVDETIFAGDATGTIYRSTNGGTTWQSVYNGGNGAITDLVYSPTYSSDRTVFASIAGFGVAKSTDGGDHWTQNNLGLSSPLVTSLAISPQFQQDRAIVVGVWEQGVFASVNGGTSWSRINRGLSDLKVSDVEISPDATLYATTALQGIFRSTNRGSNWQKANTGIEQFDGPVADAHGSLYYDIVYSPNFGSDRTLYLGSYSGLYRSTTGGDLWTELELVSPGLNREVVISPAYGTDETIFAATYGGGLLRSQNSGDDWSFLNTGLENPFLDNMALSPNYGTDRTVFLGTFEGVEVSTDGGASWTFRPLQSGKTIYVRDLAVSPNYANDRTLFAGGINVGNPADNGFYRSTDGGTTWQKITNGLPANPQIHYVAVSPNVAVDRTIYVALEGAGVYKSTDFGTTWSAANNGIATLNIIDVAISPNFAADRTLFAGTKRDGLFRSVDAGATWVHIENGLPFSDIRGIAFSPNFASDGTLFVAAGVGGVYRSTDRGNTWSAATSGLSQTAASFVSISPNFAVDRTLVAATDSGTYRSTDAGANWQLVQNVARYEDSGGRIAFQGQWANYQSDLVSSSTLRYSTRRNDAAEIQFVGTGFRWIAAKGPNHGRAAIYIDGNLVTEVNLFASQLTAPGVVAEIDGLSNGAHTLRIVLLDNKLVSIDAIDVLRSTTSQSAAVARSSVQNFDSRQQSAATPYTIAAARKLPALSKQAEIDDLFAERDFEWFWGQVTEPSLIRKTTR